MFVEHINLHQVAGPRAAKGIEGADQTEEDEKQEATTIVLLTKKTINQGEI